MDRGQSRESRVNDLPGVRGDRYIEQTECGVPPAYDGTIASACESAGISLEKLIEMMRWARESDPGVAQLLDTWDALDPSERQLSGTVDAECWRIGLAPAELLRIVADVACRIAMYRAQIIAAVSHPLVVEKTVERALTDEGIADRMAKIPMARWACSLIQLLEPQQADPAGLYRRRTRLPAGSSPFDDIPSLSQRFKAEAIYAALCDRHTERLPSSPWLLPILVGRARDLALRPDAHGSERGRRMRRIKGGKNTQQRYREQGWHPLASVRKAWGLAADRPNGTI